MSESEGTDVGLSNIPLKFPKEARIPLGIDGKAEITQSMKGRMIGEVGLPYDEQCAVCQGDEDLVDPGCELCGGNGYVTHYEALPWTTMKDIYQAMAAIAIEDLKNNKV